MTGKEYLSFSKRERTGIICLVALVIIIAVLPRYLFPADHPKPIEAFSRIQETQVGIAAGNMETGLTIDSISRGVRPAERRNQRHPFSSSNYRKRADTRYNGYQRPKVIEINSADTAAFIALPGIGSKLAARIVLFRDRLGGFVNVDQVREVYGLQDSVFRLIRPGLKCDSSLIRKIDINLCPVGELKVHPYIRWSNANALIAYREQHGDFKSPDDLLKVVNLDQGFIEKISPYLLFNESKH